MNVLLKLHHRILKQKKFPVAKTRNRKQKPRGTGAWSVSAAAAEPAWGLSHHLGAFFPGNSESLKGTMKSLQLRSWLDGSAVESTSFS